MATLGSSLAFTVDRVPRAPAIVSGTETFTYAEFEASVNQLARALIARGVSKGDRVALVCANSPEFMTTLYAVARLGAIFVPVNPRSAPPEITHVLDDCGAKVVLSEVEASAIVAQALGPAKLPTQHLSVGSGGVAPDILAEAADLDSSRVDIEVQESDDAVILYTSGTTGLAKGVLMDHHRIMWAGISVSLGTAGIKEGSTLVHVAPMYHSGQLALMVITGVMLGAKHVLVRQFDPVALLKTMEAEKVNAFFGVPTMYQLMLDTQRDLRVDLSAWTTGFYGAAPMPKDTAARIQSEFPHAQIYSFFGQTEAGPNGIFSYPREVSARPDVTGYRAAPMMAVKVVDSEGREVSDGEVGEVLLRGESVMKGYWNNPGATADTLRDGWLHTGDLARVDWDGGITIVDRLKDMIISGGRNIYSSEVELAVASHPDVLDCAVIGRPHGTYGETVVAVVTLREGSTLSLESLRAHCAERISDYKLPREMVVGQIPRNPSGKILKRTIRGTLGG